jgi:HEAT repeat protein
MKVRHVTAAGVVLAVAVGVVLILAIPTRKLDAELRDPNPAVRAAAVRSLDAETDSDRLLAALKDENADVRLLSVMQLGNRRPERKAPLTEQEAAGLIEALKDHHMSVRREAAEVLARLWPCSEAAVIRGLKDSDAYARAGAALAVSQAPDGRLGREVTPVQEESLQPLLRDLLNDEDPEVRANAALALYRSR